MTADLFAEKPARLDTRPALIGMNNPLGSTPGYELYPAPNNCAGHRLWLMLSETAQLKGVEIWRKNYIDDFHRRNVLQSQKWSKKDATVGGALLMPQLLGATSVIVLGVPTCLALGLRRPDEWCRWVSSDGLVRWCLLPHPSGRTRNYNDPLVRRAAGERLWEAWAYRAGWPANP